ncbi:MAG: LysR family transcriptional regulator [Labilithrix sp.]|nr:LysR family transcriptional regulator [Labilithrix sp.]
MRQGSCESGGRVNYQHLLYFRTVAVLGGVTAAAQRLRLTPPTLSAQIRTLEEAMGVPLFDRSARGMTLTDSGRVALRYADRIFALGAELEQALRGDVKRVVRVGVESSIVAATVRPLLGRLAGSNDDERVVCSFGSHDELLASLRALDLDLVLTNVPVTESTGADIGSRLVVETDVAFFADEKTAAALRPGFPTSLQGASFVAPPRTALRESIERWLARVGVRLATNIELGDASIAAALAADGVGIVAAPLSAEVELRKRYDLARVGVAENVLAQIHAVGSTESLATLLPALLAEEAAPTPRPSSDARADDVPSSRRADSAPDSEDDDDAPNARAAAPELATVSASQRESVR